MNEACTIEMSSSKFAKHYNLASVPLKNHGISHSLDSLTTISYPRAQPNEYETFYRTPVTSSQTSLTDVLVSRQEGRPSELRRMEMTDSEGLCTSDSYTASSELSESKYDESSLSHPTQTCPTQQHETQKKQLRKAPQSQDPYILGSNIDDFSPICFSSDDPERPPTSKTSSRRQLCRNKDYYLGEYRTGIAADSRCSTPYESWEDIASRSRSRNQSGSLPSTFHSQPRVQQRTSRQQQKEKYRHKKRKPMASTNPACWSTDMGPSYTNRNRSHSLGSTTTLTTYVDDFQPQCQPHHTKHRRDPHRPPRGYRSRSSSVDDLSSVVGPYKNRYPDQRSISSQLESNPYSRQPGQQQLRSDRKLSSNYDLDSRKQSMGKTRDSGGRLQNDPPMSLLSGHLAMVDELDFASFYGIGSRKIMGPALFGLLVIIMLLSLGLAIYFALGTTKDAEFSTANIRLRIVNSTLGKELNYLSQPAFQDLSSNYCKQMDRFYLQSALKKTYRGCEVNSLKQQFINFTLYFKEKKISNNEVESVLKTLSDFLPRPGGKTTAVIDKLEIEIRDIKVVIGQKIKKLDFDKTQTQVDDETPNIEKPSLTVNKSKKPNTKPTRQKENDLKTIKNPNIPGGKFIKINRVEVKSEKDHIKNAVSQKLSTTFGPGRKNLMTTTLPSTKTISTAALNREMTTKISKTTAENRNVKNVSVSENISLNETLEIKGITPSLNPCTTRKTGELISHPLLCDKFFQCVYGRGVVQSCQEGTWFDQDLNVCNLKPKDAVCRPKYKTETSPPTTHFYFNSSTAFKVTKPAIETATIKSPNHSNAIINNGSDEAFTSSADLPLIHTALKEYNVSIDTERKMVRIKNRTELKNGVWSSTTQGPLNDLQVILKEAHQNAAVGHGRYEDNLVLKHKTKNWTRSDIS